jgi:hypothetical protein
VAERRLGRDRRSPRAARWRAPLSRAAAAVPRSLSKRAIQDRRPARARSREPLPAFLGHLDLAQTEGDGSARRQRPYPHLRRRPGRARQRLLEPAEAFAEVPPHLPEEP